MSDMTRYEAEVYFPGNPIGDLLQSGPLLVRDGRLVDHADEASEPFAVAQHPGVTGHGLAQDRDRGGG